jgi:iron(III) transport system permease protein
MTDIVGEGTVRDRRVRLKLPSSQDTVSVLVLVFCGVLVLYPMVYLVVLSLNVGDPQTFPPDEFGIEHYRDLFESWRVIANTAFVASIATVMAILIGFLAAWALTRTQIPGVAWLERLMQLPYYMTPLVGALAWSILAAPRTGFLNQLWHAVGGSGDLFNAYSPWGIAWVMALFEGTVAFVMIAAAMKSMDPALEESARVLGAGKWRVMLTVTLPLVLPGVAGAAVFVFAEMLGSFAAAFVLGIPARFVVITTAIWQAVTMYPADYGRAAALGIGLFAVMFLTLSLYRMVIRRGHFATITGKAFRPRPMQVGRLAWLLFALCLAYVIAAVVLPLAVLLLTSFERFATVILPQAEFTLANYEAAFGFAAIRLALTNSLVLGVGVATVGVAIMTVSLDHLPLASAGTRRHRIPRDVSASGASSGVRACADAGLADHTDPDLRNALVDGVGVSHGADAARGPDLGRGSAPNRQEPRGMRPGLRGIVGLPDAHGDAAAAAAGDNRRMAVGVHCQR